MRRARPPGAASPASPRTETLTATRTGLTTLTGLTGLTALTALTALGGAALAVGCGKDDAPRQVEGPLRLEVVVDGADGPAPRGLSLRATGGRLLPLEPDPAAGPDVVTAHGPAGTYAIVAPEPWALVGQNALDLTPGQAPSPAPLGHARTLYVLPSGPSPFRLEAAVWRAGAPEKGPLSTEAVAGTAGRLLLRFREVSQYRGRVALAVRLDEGGIATAEVDLPADGSPTGAPASAAATRPLDVRVLRAADGRPLPGVPVEVEGDVGLLVARSAGTTDAEGRAALPAVSAAGPSLRVRVGGPGPRTLVEVSARDWLAALELPVLHLDGGPHDGGPRDGAPDGPPRVRVVFEGEASGRPVASVQARPAGGVSYARVAGDAKEGLRLPRGRHRLLVVDGARGAVADVDVDEPVETVAVRLEALCRVSLRVRAALPYGSRFRVSIRRREDDGLASAHGWALPVEGGDATVSLPTGSYAVALSLEGPAGRRAYPEASLVLRAPGTQAVVDLPGR